MFEYSKTIAPDLASRALLITIGQLNGPRGPFLLADRDLPGLELIGQNQPAVNTRPPKKVGIYYKYAIGLKIAESV